MVLDKEGQLQDTIRQAVGGFSSRVLENFGGGGAVLQVPRGRMHLQTASLVEKIHFDLSYSTPRELGHRVLAVALSAMACRGAKPRYVSLSTGLRQDQGEMFLGEVYGGAGALARQFKIDVVGEEVYESPSFTVVQGTAVGETKGKHLGMEPREGDLVFVTGTLGASSAGLTALKRLGRSEAQKSHSEVVLAHLAPSPQILAGEALLKLGGVGAVADLKDGLARDFYRLLSRSGLGGVLDEGAVPLSAATIKTATYLNYQPMAWGLYGGEDFQLLFTLRPSKVESLHRAFKRLKVTATQVGEVGAKNEAVRLKNQMGETVPLLPRQWSHFARRG